MPTPVTHFVVGATLSQGARPPRGAWLKTAVVFGFLASVQDLDFLMLAFGVPLNHPVGHRGLTHSLAFAVVLGIAGAVVLGAHRRHRRAFVATAAAGFLAAASHGLLDMVTRGGSGVGILMPFFNERWVFPFRPINVSLLRSGDFFPSALRVFGTELLWIWLPLALATGLRWLFSAADTLGKRRQHRPETMVGPARIAEPETSTTTAGPVPSFLREHVLSRRG